MAGQKQLLLARLFLFFGCGYIRLALIYPSAIMSEDMELLKIKPRFKSMIFNKIVFSIFTPKG